VGWTTSCGISSHIIGEPHNWCKRSCPRPPGQSQSTRSAYHFLTHPLQSIHLSAMAVPIHLLLFSGRSPQSRNNNPGMMVAEVTQRISGYLTKFLRSLHTSSRLGAFALPPEIILIIISHLNKHSITTLALTCTTLYSLCFPEQRLLDVAEKEELLQLLEKDVARLYFCHDCVKLHPWHRRWSRSMSPWYLERTPCKRNGLHLSNSPIPYFHARLVMNRHFYGPTHGPPIAYLEALFHSPGNFMEVVKSEVQHARIVDDQLLVLVVRSMYHQRGGVATLRSYIDRTVDAVCKHITEGKGREPRSSPVQPPELVREEGTSRMFRPCEQALGSCTLCLTDYRVGISWKGEEKGYVIEVQIYRQLGDCQSPRDWSWYTISNRETEMEPRTVYPEKHRTNCVRDRWHKADGAASRTRGKWVEIPSWMLEGAMLVRQNAVSCNSLHTQHITSA
jgi:hypothetical protein